MAKLTKESFVKSLKEMNIKEVMELVDAMKEEFGIDPTAVTMVADSKTNEKEEKTKSKVTISLKSVGGNKVSIIKLIKEILGVGLMDAKKISETTPAIIKENIKPEEAEEIKIKIEKAGGEAEIA